MFQAERRCWRFGQKNPVDVYVITSEKEGAVVKNIEHKQKEFDAMMRGMIASTQKVTAKNIRRIDKLDDTYDPKIVMELPSWI
jgi:SNF2 family DNA or RNA helicase